LDPWPRCPGLAGPWPSPSRDWLPPELAPHATDASRSRKADRLSSLPAPAQSRLLAALDRKSTRLNSSHVASSYAVFCWKKKNSGVRRQPMGGGDELGAGGRDESGVAAEEAVAGDAGRGG